nr:MAG TPA: hypothetical protein [Caudoviricetes sp.]
MIHFKRMKEWIPGIFYDPLSIAEKLRDGTNRSRRAAGHKV